MATTNLGKVAVVPKGEYSSAVQYERLDIVQYERSSYLVKQAVIGVTPTDGDNYALLAGKGDSSYDVAVNNGFIGTEAEWQLYLKSDGSIQALQQFMTSPASTEVSVPDYGNIPSLQGYISTMFENGGLPATPFATRALMTASALVDGKYAMVIDDTVNNGLYVKTAGSWVKSAYDPLTVTKEFSLNNTDSKINEALSKISKTIKTAPLLAFADANDAVFAEFDKDAGFHLVGLDGTVQDEITGIKKSSDNVKIEPSRNDLYTFLDIDGQIVAKIDIDGGLHLAGLPSTVQEHIRDGGLVDSNKSYSVPQVQKTRADLFEPSVLSSLSYLKVFGEMADVPRNLLPQQYHINQDWVESLSVVNTVRLPIDAYQDRGSAQSFHTDTSVVHPSVISFDKQFAGYKHWLVLTPYLSTFEDFELPYVYGTNNDDLTGWVLIDGLPKPFDVDPLDKNDNPALEVYSGHLSDPFFTYDPNTGELWVMWRRSLYYDEARTRQNARQGIYGRKTTDGTTWSEIIDVLPQYTNLSQDIMLSPTIVYNPNDNMFWMYSANNTVNAKMTVRKSKTLANGKWSAAQAVDGFDKCDPYHLEVKWIGDSIVAFVHDYNKDHFTFLTSYNGVDFVEGNQIISGLQTYKGSFVPSFNSDGKMICTMFYTTNFKATSPWKLYKAVSTPLNVGV